MATPEPCTNRDCKFYGLDKNSTGWKVYYEECYQCRHIWNHSPDSWRDKDYMEKDDNYTRKNSNEYTVELLCGRGCKHLQNGDFCSKYNKILFAYFIDTVKCKDCWEDKDE